MSKWLMIIFAKALELGTPSMVANLREFVDKQFADAKETVNPFDDILWGTLQVIVGKPGDVVSGNSQE